MLMNQFQNKQQKAESHKTLKLVQEYTDFINYNISQLIALQRCLAEQIMAATNAMQIINYVQQFPGQKVVDRTKLYAAAELNAMNEYLQVLSSEGAFKTEVCDFQCRMLEKRMRRFLTAD